MKLLVWGLMFVFVLLPSVYGASTIIYQEDPDANLTDSSARYVYVNYTKPDFNISLDALWQVKAIDHPTTLTENLSIPSECFGYNETVLVLRLDSNQDFTNADCYNGTAWDTVKQYGTPGGCSPNACNSGSGGNPDDLIDGDYSNFAFWCGNVGAWRTTSSCSALSYAFEEAVFWNVTNSTSVTVENIVNGSLIQEFCLNLSPSGGDACTTTGSLEVAFNGTFNASVYSVGVGNRSEGVYYNTSGEDVLVNGSDLLFSVAQAYVNVSAFQLFTGDSLTTFNGTNNRASNTTTGGSVLVPAIVGSNNVQVDVPGNYSVNGSCSLSSPLTINACNVSGVYDSLFTVGANNGGASVSTFSVRATNATLTNTTNASTTTGNVTFQLLQNYWYEFNVSVAGFEGNVTSVLANNATQTFNATLGSVILNITFLEGLNRTSLSGTNISVAIIFSNGTEENYWTNTSNLTLESQLPVGEYTIRYGAVGYSLRDYYFDLEAAETNLTLYLIQESDYNAGVVEVFNPDGTFAPGAVVVLKRYYGNPLIPNIVQQATTNDDGRAVFVAETITAAYTWEVYLNDVLRFDTTTPELLVLESDGLWHKVFILDENATEETNPNTGFQITYSPIGKLQNGTAYTFEANVTSTAWDVTSCSWTLTNPTTGETLGNDSGFCGTTGGIGSVSYTPPSDMQIRGTLSVSTSAFTNTYTTYWGVNLFTNESFTLEDAADDIASFSGGGFNDFSRFALSLIGMMGVVVFVGSRRTLLQNPSVVLLLVFALSLVPSYFGWLRLDFEGIPFEPLKDWLVSVLLGLITLIVGLRDMRTTQ